MLLALLLVLSPPPPPWSAGATTEQIINEGLALSDAQPAGSALEAARFCYSLTTLPTDQYEALLALRQSPSRGWVRQNSQSDGDVTILSKGSVSVQISDGGPGEVRTCSFRIPVSSPDTLNTVQRVAAAAYLQKAAIIRVTGATWRLGNGETVEFVEEDGDSARVITVTHSPTSVASARDR